MAHPEPGDDGRRRFIQSTAALGLLHAFRGVAPAYAAGVPGPGGELRLAADVVIARTPFGHEPRLEGGGEILLPLLMTLSTTWPGPVWGVPTVLHVGTRGLIPP